MTMNHNIVKYSRWIKAEPLKLNLKSSLAKSLVARTLVSSTIVDILRYGRFWPKLEGSFTAWPCSLGG